LNILRDEQTFLRQRVDHLSVTLAATRRHLVNMIEEKK
jgi:hypothetical protein